MTIAYASVQGGLIGFFIGLAIVLVMNVGVNEALIRMGVLIIAGAWMGALLAWLSKLLVADDEGQDHDKNNGTMP
ncbi:MAG: hypothetical protein R8M38_05860 [Mariprofundaceae bacterium]